MNSELNPDHDGLWEVRRSEELLRSSKLSARPVLADGFDIENIPPTLRCLLSLALRWGIADDVMRDAFVAEATPVERAELVAAIQLHSKELDEWLGGSESYRQPPHPEYIAFTAMRMAADTCEWM